MCSIRRRCRRALKKRLGRDKNFDIFLHAIIFTAHSSDKQTNRHYAYFAFSIHSCSGSTAVRTALDLGPVVQSPISTNPGLTLITEPIELTQDYFEPSPEQ